MSVKKTAQKQYQARINNAAAAAVRDLKQLPEGWIASVRKALGISGMQLGRMVGRTRANISAAERSELEERATLQTMKTLAEAMGCRFVYAIIPAKGDIHDIIERQALRKATKLVSRASTHMALEKQALSEKQNQYEIRRLADELIRNPSKDFWEDA